MKEFPPLVREAWAKYFKEKNKLCEKAWRSLEKGKYRSAAEAAEGAKVEVAYFRKWCARYHSGELDEIYRKLYKGKHQIHPYTPKQYIKPGIAFKRRRMRLPCKCPHCGKMIGE